MNRLSLRAIAKNTLLLLLPFAISIAAVERGYALTRAYVTNQTDNTVSVINTLDQTVVAPPLVVGNSPFGVAVAPAADYFYVVSRAENKLSQVNVATGVPYATHVTGSDPVGVAVSPDSAFAYVTNHAAATISAIHVTDASVETITLSGAPFGVTAHPDGKLLYVTDDSSNQLLVVDLTTKLVTPLTVGNHPTGVAVTSTGSSVVVANGLDNTVSILATVANTVSAPITVGKNPFGVAITPDDRYAYVTNTDDDTVSVIDLASYLVINTIPVGDGPMGVAVTGNGGYVYVVNNLAGTVSVIATVDNSVLPAVIPVGNNPVGFGGFIGGPKPAPPTNLIATLAAEGTISLNWTDTATDELGFKIERRKYIQGAYTTIATVGGDVTSFTDPGLDANANYYYRIRAYKDEGFSAYSNETYATTEPGKSGCFIATAAYGSTMEPQVQLLRDFRDHFMTGNLLGQAFVSFYYKNSPPLARYIAEHDTWRLVVRCCLLPLLGLAWLSLALSSLPGLLVAGSLLSLLGVGGAGFVYLKKRGRQGEEA